MHHVVIKVENYYLDELQNGMITQNVMHMSIPEFLLGMRKIVLDEELEEEELLESIRSGANIGTASNLKDITIGTLALPVEQEVPTPGT